MSFVDTANQHHRTTIIIDTFDDGTTDLFRFDRIMSHPPCSQGGCRPLDFEQEHCEYDPKTGQCGGRMP